MILAVYGEHKNRGSGEQLAQMANHLDARHSRQSEIGQHHVGPLVQKLRKGLVPRAVLADHFHSGRSADERGQTFTRSTLIFYKRHSNRIGHWMQSMRLPAAGTTTYSCGSKGAGPSGGPSCRHLAVTRFSGMPAAPWTVVAYSLDRCWGKYGLGRIRGRRPESRVRSSAPSDAR